MRPIDSDQLKSKLRQYSKRMIDVASRTETHIDADIVRAIDLKTLNHLIDIIDTINYDIALEQTKKERDNVIARYKQLEEYVNNNCIKKDILLSDMREIIDDLNDNNLNMTNEQLYDVLKREVEAPLYDRPAPGDSD